MSHHDENVFAAVGDSAVDLQQKQRAIERRARSRVRGLNHHAYYSADAATTRHFYEDILEMPMTIALRIPEEVFTGRAAPYCHFFFEMGDGSSIAFFDYPDVFDGKPPFEVSTVYHHHIAINVDSDESIEYFRQRLEKEGYPSTFVDHGAFHSLYVRDPNGMNLELCYSPPETEDFFLRAERVARDELDKWAAKRG
ncbi:VOC family protein [Paraburkholderia elongata]|uniref:VOC family protein n=1 Tax=Paraburkholderia elongata TaxID=2675747 RepID=A0A972SFA5_9BURK|nr:VOC family protein [Paraburkholderia elongata]NPT53638.1 VOC family protein [Paraburkholderia elongata]